MPDRPALREWHAQLIALRKQRPALHGGGFLPLHVGTDDELYVFARAPSRGADAISIDGNAKAGELAIVALNFGARAASARITLPAGLARLHGARFRDALGGGDVRARGVQLTFALPAWGVRILEPR